MVPSLRALADALGCSATTVRRYARRGLVVAALDGTGFDVERTRAAVRHAKRRGELGTAALKCGQNPDILRLRARVLEERARLLELERREREGKLVDREEVIREYAKLVIAARTKILAVPQRLRQRFPELPLEVVRHAEVILREALEELAKGADP